MKSNESIRLEQSEFRKAVERARKEYSESLERTARTVNIAGRRGKQDSN